MPSMNHGYEDEDDQEVQYNPRPRGVNPGGILAQLMGGGMGSFGRFGAPPPPTAYDEYYKAYSIAVMGGKEREELLYGGKIIMPPSALAKLSALDLPSPWTFHLRNPRNPTQNQTHAGVLEFIAEEGIVHLPAWMMKTLALQEGDPVRLTGAQLAKGTMVKIQAQSTDFLQVSDAKAVLESALRFYSTLTQGDIIEITYNSMTFDFLIITTTPVGPGISIIDTDLEVDFETPVGYVEPPRPEPKAIPTMAEKLNIDLSGTSRPESRASGGSGGAGESFVGVGMSLSGKRVKGKGLGKKIEEMDTGSNGARNGTPRILTPSTLNDLDRKVPVALKLPAGKFFFGFKYVPFDESKAPKATTAAAGPVLPFGGEGSTLRRGGGGVAGGSGGKVGEGSVKTEKGVGKEEEGGGGDPWAKLGGGNTLRGGGGASASGSSAKRKAEDDGNVGVALGGGTRALGVGAAAGGGGGIIDATMSEDSDDGIEYVGGGGGGRGGGAVGDAGMGEDDFMFDTGDWEGDEGYESD